ncbi:MAG: D-alanyl-D-alanine carboxypeptidase family protein [Oscillospiraceae bacterium]|nr:D-alanyl-D-alanine carboxypeptidase family protein [Oscillospiraceae bacterium]
MRRRVDYGRIAVLLSMVILGIFAVDFARRTINRWRGENGQLIVQTPSGVDSGGITPPQNNSVSSQEDQNAVTTTTTEAANQPKLTLLASEVYIGSLVLVDADHPWRGNAELVTFADLDYAHFRLPSRALETARSSSQSLVTMFKDFYQATSLPNVMIYATTKTPTAAAYGMEIPERATGLTIDLTVWDDTTQSHSAFKNEGNYTWLTTHCAEYGYVQRFPADKAEITGVEGNIWHYRYVGVPHAAYMTQQQLCLEEYLSFLQENHTSDHPLTVNANGQSYQISYIPASTDGSMLEIPVPANTPITVSGDNMGGYILTIQNKP